MRSGLLIWSALAAACAVSIGCDEPAHATSPDFAGPPRLAGAVVSAARGEGGAFTRQFPLERCTFATRGDTPYFPLLPGHTRELAGGEGPDRTVLRITVLDHTRMVGGVTTRVVEEVETLGGELVEISQNYFAVCAPNNSLFYFGEDVDIYEGGRIVSHEGTWHHGENGARAGLMMAGLSLLGARYFQEVAPGVALDRAEVLSLDETLSTPAGRFGDVLLTEETTPLEPGSVGRKWYAPGIGLVRDGDASLVRVTTGSTRR